MKRTKLDLLKKIHGGQVSQIVSACAKLKLCDYLKNGPRSLNELESILHIPDSRLRRFLYALIHLNILKETECDCFELTEEGAFLISDHEQSLYPIALFKGSRMLSGANACLYEGLKSGEAPLKHAFGLDLFDFLEQNQEEFDIFHEAMLYYEKTSSKKILDFYDFTHHHSIIDIGCGMGTLLSYVKQKYPHLQVTGYDLPSVVAKAKTISPHLNYISGDFFESIPQGYDLYLLRNILHDWSDEKCLQLLKNLKNSVESTSKLLLLETVTAEVSSSHVGRFSDLNMFILTGNGKERSLSEIKALLTQADAHLSSFHQTLGSSKTLFEINL